MKDKQVKGRSPHGEGHYAFRLTTAEVELIRGEYSKGANQYDLGERFGVGQTHISRIVRGTARRAG
jgi:predicted DNA-binding protein (UPF0251 family)